MDIDEALKEADEAGATCYSSGLGCSTVKVLAAEVRRLRQPHDCGGTCQACENARLIDRLRDELAKANDRISELRNCELVGLANLKAALAEKDRELSESVKSCANLEKNVLDLIAEKERNGADAMYEFDRAEKAESSLTSEREKVRDLEARLTSAAIEGQQMMEQKDNEYVVLRNERASLLSALEGARGAWRDFLAKLQETYGGPSPVFDPYLKQMDRALSPLPQPREEASAEREVVEAAKEVCRLYGNMVGEAWDRLYKALAKLRGEG